MPPMRRNMASVIRAGAGIDTIDVAETVDSLEAFARRLGPRYLPAALLVEMAREGKTFY